MHVTIWNLFLCLGLAPLVWQPQARPAEEGAGLCPGHAASAPLLLPPNIILAPGASAQRVYLCQWQIAAGARAGPGELGAGLCHWCAQWDKGVTNLLGGALAAGSFTLWYKLYVCIRPEGNGDMWH